MYAKHPHQVIHIPLSTVCFQQTGGTAPSMMENVMKYTCANLVSSARWGSLRRARMTEFLFEEDTRQWPDGTFGLIRKNDYFND